MWYTLHGARQSLSWVRVPAASSYHHFSRSKKKARAGSWSPKAARGGGELAPEISAGRPPRFRELDESYLLLGNFSSASTSENDAMP